MDYKECIDKAKNDIDSVNEFLNLIEKNSDTFKKVGISVSFKSKTIF